MQGIIDKAILQYKNMFLSFSPACQCYIFLLGHVRSMQIGVIMFVNVSLYLYLLNAYKGGQIFGYNALNVHITFGKVKKTNLLL